MSSESYRNEIIVKKTEKRLVKKLPRPDNEPLFEGEPFPRWYAVQTKPRQEEDADRSLRRMRYHTFFPHLRERRRIGKLLTREFVVPLFPRYLFLGLRQGMSLYYANEAVGVSRVVPAPGGDPLEIPSRVMTEIMGRCDGDGDEISPDDDALPIFGGRPGDSVLLGPRAGAWQGLVRQILRVKGSSVILDFVVGELEVPLDHVAEVFKKRRGK